MQMIGMSVRNINIVEPLRIDGIYSGFGVRPPLSTEAGTGPPRIRQNVQTASFYKDRSVSDKRYLHDTSLLSMSHLRVLSRQTVRLSTHDVPPGQSAKDGITFSPNSFTERSASS